MSQLKIGEHDYNDGDNQCKIRMTQDNFDEVGTCMGKLYSTCVHNCDFPMRRNCTKSTIR